VLELSLLISVFTVVIAAPIVFAAIISVYIHAVIPIVCECVVNMATDAYAWAWSSLQALLPSTQPEPVADGETS
jgi:hypothetical protein